MEKTARDFERQIRDALLMVPAVACKVWVEMRYWMDQGSGRAGYAERDGKPLTRQQLAQMTGCSPDEASQSFAALKDAGLVAETQDHRIHAPLLERIGAARVAVAKRVRKHRDRMAESVGRYVTPNVTPEMPQVGRYVTPTDPTPAPSPAPVLSSPPITPSSILTPPPAPPPTLWGAALPTERPSAVGGKGGGAVGEEGAKPAKARKRPRALSDQQVAAKASFGDWWRLEAWPRHHHGEEYPMEGADWGFAQAILASSYVKWDLDRAKQLAEVYLAEPELYGVQGHPLRMLRHRLGQWVSKAAARRQGVTHEQARKRTAESRGEYAQQFPEAVRKF